ncbi:hypothetical protein [[Eubacterium] cellulosolvens]
MVKRNFTDKEKIVFYGIIKYPGINDNALSKIIDVNPSTIATIRNKLKKQNYFHMVRIPFLQNCGYELLAISYDRLYSPTLSESPSHVLGNIYKRIPNIFYLLTAPDSWVSIGFFQNYLNLKKFNEQTRFNKFQFELQEDTEKQIIFPFGLSKIFNFFDYSRILHDFFELDFDATYFDNEIHAKTIKNLNISPSQFLNTKKPEILGIDASSGLESSEYHQLSFDGGASFKLTKAEREVFLALIQYPELSDFAINKIISISATSINNIRKKFEAQSIIRQQVIPNLSLMGFELITLTHLKFRALGNIPTRRDIIDEVSGKVPSFFYISSNTDEIIIAAYKNFSEYQHVNDEILRLYRDKDFLTSEPRTLLFPLSESALIKSHSYVPLVNQFLGRGKTIIKAILDIIGKKLGETGKQILIRHLENSEISPEEMTVKDIPKLIQIIQEVITPIFGRKSANEISNKIKKLKNS